MFTGIIDHTGEITQCEQAESGLRVAIKTSFDDLIEGESIAVNGACLTVINPQTHLFYCDISPETCELTTAKYFKVGAKVNLERAMKMGDRFGGHYVTGHVDGICTLKKVEQAGEYIAWQMKTDKTNLLIHKGSACLNGVSLTVNKVLEDGFEVMLIPHTLEITNLSDIAVGDEMNIEYDWMVKVVAQQVQEKQLGEMLK